MCNLLSIWFQFESFYLKQSSVVYLVNQGPIYQFLYKRIIKNNIYLQENLSIEFSETAFELKCFPMKEP